MLFRSQHKMSTLWGARALTCHPSPRYMRPCADTKPNAEHVDVRRLSNLAIQVVQLAGACVLQHANDAFSCGRVSQPQLEATLPESTKRSEQQAAVIAALVIDASAGSHSKGRLENCAQRATNCGKSRFGERKERRRQTPAAIYF